jgi:uracil-DNA glycosylase
MGAGASLSIDRKNAAVIESTSPPTKPTDNADKMALPVLQGMIRACTRCKDAGFIPEARPLTVGDADAPFLVIGQAPSRTAHETNTFYRGPAGERLRGWFVEAGFAPEDFGTRVYLAAVTKCFPGRLPGSSKDRLPSRAEQALCRPWLDQEISLLRPKVVVLFGGLAITTFLSRAPLKELVGRAFERDGVTYVPLPHSSGASTWLNLPEHRALLAEGIERLREARERFPGTAPTTI